MDASLLSTKFYIPAARAGLVTRPRLLERLQPGLTSDLVLVSAPAGFGKTTLLSEWIHRIQQQISSAWLHIDKGENDYSICLRART